MHPIHFLAGHQTALKFIDEEAIRRPLAATCFMLCPGAEDSHPNPETFYQAGAGPLFDFGPYYLTGLLQLLGRIKRVNGSATIAIPQRTITSQARYGKRFKVKTPDDVSGSIEFTNGCIATIVMSFASRYAEFWPITLFGTDGTMRVPDPNGFDGDVFLRRKDDEDWQNVALTPRTGFGRSVGVADMAHAIRSGRPHRASGEQAYAVVEAMQGILDFARTGQAVELTAAFQRCTPLPSDLPEGLLDD